MTIEELLVTMKSYLRPIEKRLPSFINWPWLKGWNKQIYYKVVIFQEKERRYMSASPCLSGCLEYSKSKFTHMIPGSFGLFVVGNLEEAKKIAHYNCFIGAPGKVFTCYLRGPVVKADHVLCLQEDVKEVSGLAGVTRKEKFSRAAEIACKESSCMDWVNRTFTTPPPYSHTVNSLKLKKCVYTHEWEHRDI